MLETIVYTSVKVCSIQVLQIRNLVVLNSSCIFSPPKSNFVNFTHVYKTTVPKYILVKLWYILYPIWHYEPCQLTILCMISPQLSINNAIMCMNKIILLINKNLKMEENIYINLCGSHYVAIQLKSKKLYCCVYHLLPRRNSHSLYAVIHILRWKGMDNF